MQFLLFSIFCCHTCWVPSWYLLSSTLKNSLNSHFSYYLKTPPDPTLLNSNVPSIGGGHFQGQFFPSTNGKQFEKYNLYLYGHFVSHFFSFFFYMWYVAIFFNGYHEEKLEDKHTCKSLYLIKPLVTSLTRIGPTSEKTLVTKYCQILSWNLFFWLLCLKTKAKIKVNNHQKATYLEMSFSYDFS